MRAEQLNGMKRKIDITIYISLCVLSSAYVHLNGLCTVCNLQCITAWMAPRYV